MGKYDEINQRMAEKMEDIKRTKRENNIANKKKDANQERKQKCFDNGIRLSITLALAYTSILLFFSISIFGVTKASWIITFITMIYFLLLSLAKQSCEKGNDGEDLVYFVAIAGFILLVISNFMVFIMWGIL